MYYQIFIVILINPNSYSQATLFSLTSTLAVPDAEDGGHIAVTSAHLVFTADMSAATATRVNSVQWNLYEETTKLCGLSRQVVFPDIEVINKILSNCAR